MAENSAIEWTDHTFNPWMGCTKVHEGCKHCYAETLMDSRYGKVKWGPQGTRTMTSEANWRKPLKWNRDAEVKHNAWERMVEQVGSEQDLIERGFKKPDRPKVFCASLADVFEDWQGPVIRSPVSRVARNHLGTLSACGRDLDKFPLPDWRWANLDDVRKRLFDLIDGTPHLDWLLLTKRPENIRKMWTWGWGTAATADASMEYRQSNRLDYGTGFNGEKTQEPANPCRRQNVWLGTSISRPEHYHQINSLTDCRDLASKLFLSIEPLLAPMPGLPLEGIDWVIVGGESGPGARPMHPEWVRSIRDQCVAAGVPFFFKQWGEWIQLPEFYYSPRIGSGSREYYRALSQFKKHHSASQLIDPRIEGWVGALESYGAIMDGERPLGKVGTKKSGRLLDGVEWSEFPHAM